MKKLNIISVKTGKLVDNKTISYILKSQILTLINEFMQRLKKGVQRIEIAGTFGALAYEFGDLRDEVKQREGITSVKINATKVGVKTDPKSLIKELRTLFQLPVKDLIRELDAGTISDQELFNYFDSLADTAEVWRKRTEN